MIPALIGAAVLGGFLSWAKGQGALVAIPTLGQEQTDSGFQARQSTGLYNWGLTGRSD